MVTVAVASVANSQIRSELHKALVEKWIWKNPKQSHNECLVFSWSVCRSRYTGAPNGLWTWGTWDVLSWIDSHWMQKMLCIYCNSFWVSRDTNIFVESYAVCWVKTCSLPGNSRVHDYCLTLHKDHINCSQWLFVIVECSLYFQKNRTILNIKTISSVCSIFHKWFEFNYFKLR